MNRIARIAALPLLLAGSVLLSEAPAAAAGRAPERVVTDAIALPPGAAPRHSTKDTDRDDRFARQKRHRADDERGGKRKASDGQRHRRAGDGQARRRGDDGHRKRQAHGRRDDHRDWHKDRRKAEKEWHKDRRKAEKEWEKDRRKAAKEWREERRDWHRERHEWERERREDWHDDRRDRREAYREGYRDGRYAGYRAEDWVRYHHPPRYYRNRWGYRPGYYVPAPRYVVIDDYARYGYLTPPPGFGYAQVDGDVFLMALATGLIVAAMNY